MSWLEKVLPPRIRPNAANARHQMPEGLWVKCPACDTVLYNTDLVPFRLELCVLVLGGGFLALATLFTMGVTVVRQQRLLTPGYVVVALAAWALASPFVRLWAIRGASLTYLACMVALSLWTGLIFASCVRRKSATASRS